MTTNSNTTIQKKLTQEEHKKICQFISEHLYVQMRHDSPHHPGKYAEIVGYREINGELYYTIRFADFETTEIPFDPKKLSKLCIGSPRYNITI